MNHRIPGSVPLIGQNVTVSPQHATFDGPLAHPTNWPTLLHSPDGQATVLTFGGLTKVEALAAQIYKASMPEWNNIECIGEADPNIRVAVDAAEAILAECARRRQAAKESNEQAP